MDATQFTSSPSASRLSVARILENHHWQKYLDGKAFTTDRVHNVARVLNLLTACRTAAWVVISIARWLPAQFDGHGPLR